MRSHRCVAPGFVFFAMLMTLAFGLVPSASGQDVVTPAEQQLADNYAPTMSLKRGKGVCDSNAEQYFPITVDIVLNNPEVALRNEDGDIVKMAPSAQDLANLPAGFYLDFPGTPRNPGCTYAKWFQKIKGDNPPSTYAHIVNTGDGHIVLQYWFYYIFNNFNDTHESDWEMLQLTFDASSVEEALQKDPSIVAFAQHAGGETAEWGDPKLTLIDGHPHTHSSSGSHADYYADDIYLGWGDQGTGFGCDITTAPSDTVRLKAIVVPDNPDPAGDFAWATFGGRWGQKEPMVYNGPPSPNVQKKWADPLEWQDGLRDSSLTIPTTKTPGPDPGPFFCTVVKWGSWPIIHAQANPWLVGTIVGSIAALLISIVVAGRHFYDEAIALYVRNIRLFLSIGLVLIPIGIIASVLQALVVNYPPGEWIFELMNRTPGARLLAAVFIGSLQHLIGLLLVGPAVISAVNAITHGKPATLRTCYDDALRWFWPLLRALFRVVLIISLLAATVIGIPFAIHRTIRWIFTLQVVMLDGVEPRMARVASTKIVIHRWWRTAFSTLFFILMAIVPGPLIGVVLLIAGHKSVEFANFASSLVYAVALPLSVIGITLLYIRLKETERTPTPAPSPQTASPNAAPAATPG